MAFFKSLYRRCLPTEVCGSFEGASLGSRLAGENLKKVAGRLEMWIGVISWLL